MAHQQSTGYIASKTHLQSKLCGELKLYEIPVGINMNCQSVFVAFYALQIPLSVETDMTSMYWSDSS